MTKRDIVSKMQEETGIPATRAAQVLDDILDIMKQSLIRGENIKIVRFGRFSVKKKNSRRGRNPQTGDILTIPDHNALTFTPSKLLRQRL
jgi:integration host factor subunit alpha